MHLIIILLTTVSVLTFLSGIIVFFGSSKKERARAALFLLAATFATAWMTSISFFLTATPETINPTAIDWHVKWTFASAVLIDLAFFGYISWHEKYGKPLLLFFTLFGAIVCGLIFYQPGLLYSEIVLAKTGNSVIMNIGPLYFGYIAFFSTIVPAVVMTLLRQFVKSRSARKKNGDLIIMGSFGTSSILTLFANLILPFFDNWSLIWIGPLALAVTIISFYYTILRYRSLNLASVWLKIFSYIVIIASLAIIYMIIFSVIFAALFRGSAPSAEVIILNFIMILIFLLLMPAMNTLSNFIKSLIIDPKNNNKEKTLGHGNKA